MKFQEGDRVICVRPHPDDNNNIEVGMTGTIIGNCKLGKEEWLSVEWDYDVGGHDCDHQCAFGYGWNVRHDYIDIIKESPKTEVKFNLAEIL